MLAAALAAALMVIGPVEGAAQGPPPHAEAKREQARGQEASRARAQSPQQAPQAQQAQRPPQAQRPQQAERGQAQRPPQAGQPGQRPPQAQQGPPGQAGQQGRAGRPGDPPGRSQDSATRGPGAGGPPAHAAVRRGGPAPAVEAYNRGLAERVVRVRSERHEGAPAVQVRRQDGDLRLVRSDGQVLFTVREETADRLGYWRAVVAPPVGAFAAAPDRSRGGERYPVLDDDPPRNGAPAFCRSGEGHPVWGRNWCLDMGFGLGDGRRSWAVTRPIEDIVFGRPDTRRRYVEQEDLSRLLGELVLGRLAFQAVALGASEPLRGTWIGEPQGPVTLRVVSGGVPVAELVDYDRNGRVDTIVFNLGR
jgi:hypothetical protein